MQHFATYMLQMCMDMGKCPQGHIHTVILGSETSVASFRWYYACTGTLLLFALHNFILLNFLK